MKNFLIKKSFRNFDEFAHTAREWNLDFKQLDRGECRAEMLQFAYGKSLLDYAKFNRRFDQHGSPPAGKWTFAIFSNHSPSLVWHEKEISNNTLALFRPGAEMDCVTQPGFESFTLSYSEDALNEIASNLGLPEIKKMVAGTDNFECSAKDLFVIRRKLQYVIDAVQYSSKSEINSLARTLETELSEQVLLLISSRYLLTMNSSLRERNQAIRKIKQYLREHPYEILTVNQLCKIAGISIRTLQYAFQNHYGVTPKTYLKNLRLNNVRRELWKSDPVVTKVNDISSLWGFWHMGQFAADYRKLFGELPSETLRKVHERNYST